MSGKTETEQVRDHFNKIFDSEDFKEICEEYYMRGYKDAKDKYVPKMCPVCGLSRTFSDMACKQCLRAKT
jgi:hypothetical protein